MIHEKLATFINNEKKRDFKNYSLDSIIDILNYFGNPHKSLKAIHIAGTNGKGSTAYFLESICRKSGYKTGRYTSPHLIKINERISIDNYEITDITLNSYLDKIIEYAESIKDCRATYFDIITAAAFLFFHDSSIDIAIIETGLGGRYDSTNVICPVCTIITDIAMDHKEILGNTPAEITHEKAGIIKQGIPVVTTNSDSTVTDIISKKAALMSADVYTYGAQYFVSDVEAKDWRQSYNYTFVNYPDSRITVNNPVPCQLKNSSAAATAALVSHDYLPRISLDSVQQGIADTVIPGRFQVLYRDPPVIFDPAHNVPAIREVLRALSDISKSRDIIFFLSLMIDKDINSISALLRDFGSSVIYRVLDDPRCFIPGPVENNFYDTVVYKNSDLFDIIETGTVKKSLFFFIGSFRLYNDAIIFTKNLKNILEN